MSNRPDFPTAYLFTNANVFDGTGRAPFRGDVRVEGNRITSVVEGGSSNEGGDARIIDASGKTLMPGLVEPHAHLSFLDIPARELTGVPVEEHMLATVRNARKALDAGYTSMLSMASAKPRLDVALKKEIEAGHVPGPRYLACSTELTVTGGLGDANQLHLPYSQDTVFSTIVDGAAQMQRVCRTFAREGVDIIKMHLSGDLGTSGAAMPDETPMTEAEVAAAADVARASNIRIAAHCRNAESVMLALRHGVTLINHANFLDEPTLDAMEAKRGEIFVIPAASLDYRLAHADGRWGVTPQRSDSFKRELEATVTSVAAMRKRGIRVLPGGDYGFPYSPHGSYAFDLWLFTDHFGYTPAEALAAATGLGGAVMGRVGEIGVIRPGALADLLLVDGDPLADIAILQDHSRLAMILKDGLPHTDAA